MSARRMLLICGLVVCQLTGFSQLRLARVFTDHAVLQRQKPLFIWGWATPGENITITFAGQNQTTRAAADSTWRVKLQPLEAGGPFQLRVSSRTRQVTVEDVLVGEVWICSGQSNMEFKLKQALNAEDEIRGAKDPLIRQFMVNRVTSFTPAKDVAGAWTVSSSKTAGDFTAVGYFFARQLRTELNVPVGLINSSWGGTHAETWTSRQGLSQDDELKLVVTNFPVNGEAWKQQRVDKIRQLVQDKQQRKSVQEATKDWKQTETDTRYWPLMKLPGLWEGQGLAGLKGTVLFRKEIILSPTTALAQATLQLGRIIPFDSTYVNGQFVGTLNDRMQTRTYLLPPGLLKPGRNVIAVRVQDSLTSGGFFGKPELMRLTTVDTSLSLSGEWQYMPVTMFPSSANIGPNELATLLFNGMIHPLIPFALRGAIWYQGEANVGRAYQYRRAFPLLIQDWRQHWQKATGISDEFAFLFVQLANFQANGGNSRKGSTWAELREAQAMTLRLPQTGMAVTSDVGESGDIHPRNKQEVGRRLAAEALRVAYGQNRVSTGPTFANMKFEVGKAVLDFINLGQGLTTPDKYGYLRGFEVAGSDQVFHPARAEIRGSQVVVWSEAVAVPAAVRYGWADDNGEVNLYNREGFPAVPFRTDSWKGITENKRFDN